MSNHDITMLHPWQSHPNGVMHAYGIPDRATTECPIYEVGLKVMVYEPVNSLICEQVNVAKERFS